MAASTGLWHRLSNNLFLACLSLPPLSEVIGPDQGLVFSLMQKLSEAGSSGVSVAKKPCSGTRMESHENSRKSFGDGVSGISLTLREKETMENDIPNHGQSTASSASSSSAAQVGTLPIFLDQGSSIASYRFVLNMVKGHHLQLRAQPQLFCNFQQFNIKAAIAPHPISQKEVLLAEGH